MSAEDEVMATEEKKDVAEGTEEAAGDESGEAYCEIDRLQDHGINAAVCFRVISHQL